MNKFFLFFTLITLTVGCNQYDYEKSLKPNIYIDYSESRGVFVTCEGNFMFGNASLSFYNKETGSVDNSIFYNTNKFPLGDVAQSMIIYKNLGFVVMNNSGKIYVIDVNSGEYKGAIKPLTSPRYIEIISDTKGYITDLYSPTLTIFNPSTLEVTGYIYIGYGGGSLAQRVSGTEQMVQKDGYLYVTSWSYNNKVYKIDINSDKLVDSLTVGKQPNSIVKDKNGDLWVLCDGAYAGSGYGYEKPSLWKISTPEFSVNNSFIFDDIDSSPSELTIDAQQENLYFINGAMLTNVQTKLSGIYKMSINSTKIPEQPVIHSSKEQLFYGLAIDDSNGDIYVTDAIDYNQDGIMLRYNSDFELIDNVKVGIIPGAFCFK